MSSKKPKKAPTGDYAVGYARPEGDPIPARPVWQPCWPPTGPAIPRRAAAGGGGAHRQAPGRRQGPAHGPRPRVDAQAVRYGPPGQGAGDPVGPGAPGASADRPQRQGRAAGDRQGSRSWLCDCDPALGKVERAIAQTPKIERKRIYLPVSAPWLETFEAEVASFPMSKYFDQIDSMVQFLYLLDHRNRWTIDLSAMVEHREQPF
jgi:hypothetical protein